LSSFRQDSDITVDRFPIGILAAAKTDVTPFIGPGAMRVGGHAAAA
jgi:hypothetical protein